MNISEVAIEIIKKHHPEYIPWYFGNIGELSETKDITQALKTLESEKDSEARVKIEKAMQEQARVDAKFYSTTAYENKVLRNSLESHVPWTTGFNDGYLDAKKKFGEEISALRKELKIAKDIMAGRIMCPSCLASLSALSKKELEDEPWKCPHCGHDKSWFDRSIEIDADGEETGMGYRCEKCGRRDDEALSQDKKEE